MSIKSVLDDDDLPREPALLGAVLPVPTPPDCTDHTPVLADQELSANGLILFGKEEE